ncbi:MAG: TIGR02996 domain-containing protein [Gemmataceae bacterium]|nr:TIGR02996 domain-containing protein [Gemmataceae bacterium]
MSDEKALLDAIWEAPHDNAPRLVYADWLEEHGDPSSTARAELIRVQCELARLPGDAPQYDALEARAADILAKWEKGWWKEMPRGCGKGSFSRGFPVPELGRFKLAGLVELGEARLRAAPLWRYHYGVHGRDLKVLLPWPWLHRLELFALRPPLPRSWASQLAECPRLVNVSRLALIDCRARPDEVKLLLDAWAGRSLSELTVNLDDQGVGVLVNHPTAAGLRSLDLGAGRLGSDAISALVAGRYLTGLLFLDLGWGKLGDRGLAGLLKWPGLARLRGLYVSHTELTNAAAVALASCPAVANLRDLGLQWNRIKEAGALALADSPHLARLTHLGLYDNPLRRSEAAVARLRERFGKALTI